MKRIYIVLSKTGTLFSRTIGLYTGDKYNHVSISLEESLDKMYSFGRKKPNNPFNGGFVVEGLNKGVYEKYSSTECCIYEYEVSDIVYENLKGNLDKFIANKDTYKYSLLGVLGVMVEKPIKINNAFFCSFFVAYILKESGLKLFDKDAIFVTPSDFSSVNKMKLIYEGYMKDYRKTPVICNKTSIESSY